ncbi:MAG: hypothetical protein AAB531_01250 [Patescibacteria group bacterium]
MKKNLTYLLLITLCFSIFVSSSYAISPTPKTTPRVTSTPTPSPSLIQKQINSLSSKIASRVAQLKLVEKKGIMGEVVNVSNTQITLSDIHENTKFIDVDEFTQFSSPQSKSSFGISDIKKGDKIGVLGLYNKESRRILARFIDEIDLPQVMHGVVSKMDTKNFTLVLTDLDNKTHDVNVESSTRTFSYDRDKKELVKSGFSKLEIGQTIVIVGYPGKNNSGLPAGQAGLFEASRIIALPDVTSNIKVEATTGTPTPTSKVKTTKSPGQ